MSRKNTVKFKFDGLRKETEMFQFSFSFKFLNYKLYLALIIQLNCYLSTLSSKLHTE